jgi:hypothetical protein
VPAPATFGLIIAFLLTVLFDVQVFVSFRDPISPAHGEWWVGLRGLCDLCVDLRPSCPRWVFLKSSVFS